MSRNLIVVVTLITMLAPGLTLAQCHLDGRTYDEGEVVAGYICKGGNWQAL